MKQLIISQQDTYQINDITYFKFSYGNVNYRDIYCELEKNNKYLLEIICKFCEVEHKGLKKSQLIDLIVNSNLLIIN